MTKLDGVAAECCDDGIEGAMTGDLFQLTSTKAMSKSRANIYK
jgi:hypothetical protein